MLGEVTTAVHIHPYTHFFNLKLESTGHQKLTTIVMNLLYPRFLETESNTEYHFIPYLVVYGRDSSVSIVTGYGLDGPGIRSRWG
jgi:hypothetical protein